MSEPTTSGAASALESILKLWDRSVALLFALFGICCTLFAAAVAARWFGQPDYITNYGTYLVVGGVIFGGLAIARTIERRRPSFNFILDDAQSMWTRAKQANGDVHTQISLRFQATNLTRRPLTPARAILKRPFLWRSHPLAVIIGTDDRGTGLYGRDTKIPEGLTRNVHLELLIPKKLGKAGSPLDVKVVIEDQRGHRNLMILKRVRGLA